jgi:pyocin large subunit-like protein
MFSKKSMLAIFASAGLFGQVTLLQAITIVNDTLAAMMVVGEYEGGKREDILSYIKAGDTERIALKAVPQSIFVRDVAVSWTNVPVLTTEPYSLPELNAATLTISTVEGETYRPNAPFNIETNLALGQVEGTPQAEVKRQAQAAQRPAQGQLQLSPAARADLKALGELHQRLIDSGLLSPEPINVGSDEKNANSI